MTQYIDEDIWRTALSKPDWYLRLADDFKRLEQLAEQEKDASKRKSIKREAYGIIETALREERVPLASSGDNFDQERQPIDTLVIHHTKNPPGMTLERLNAMQLIRIYGAYFARPSSREAHLKGQPIWSGHFHNGQQVFWGYHWLIRQDGTKERLLDDQAIGWHAGNWQVNTRSVGICVDDDLTNKEPNNLVLRAIADVKREYYLNVALNNVVGHCDVNDKTECPGRLFRSGWRNKLLKFIV